jgi:Lon protease-like protein
VPWEVAGALFVAGATAWAAVRAVNLTEGDTVVVSGAAGGVGSLAVQLARRAGASVIGLASEAHFQWLAGHGVVPVAYGDGVAERIRQAAGKVDAFVDTYGAEYVELALELGVEPSRIDTIANFEAVARFGVKGDGSAAGSSASVLAELAALIAAGELEEPIAATFPLDRVQDAYRRLAEGHLLGKIVLLPQVTIAAYCQGMSELLPLFPLGAVLYPGMLLPLHIFEERYRQLVRDLLERPEPRRFGVIAIRKGRETGIDGVHSLYEIGCTATLRRVDELDDGRFDLVTVGTQRFRLLALDQSLSYLQGEVELVAEDAVDQAAAAPFVRAVQVAFRTYLDALTERGGATVRIEDLPSEPGLLSFVVAATMVIDLPERQGLLDEADTVRRLNAERALLARETAMLRATTSRPAPDLRYTPYSPN